MKLKFTRDGAIWWVGMTAGAIGYIAAHFQAFPWIPQQYQGTIEGVSAGLTWLSSYLRQSPRPLSKDNPMAGTADPSRTLTITGKPKGL